MHILQVTISEDKMQAFIECKAVSEDKPLTQSDILSTLNERGVVHGIKNDAIESFLQNIVYDEPVLFAMGTEVKHGTDGQVEYCFELEKEYKPVILENGSVDYKQRNLIHNVQKDTVLAIIHPPVQGEAGQDVLGKVLQPLSIKATKLPKLKNAVVTPEGDKIVASCEGALSFDDDTITINPHYEVNNVDNTTGNIKFVGDLLIKGNVISGMVVEAGGKVEVLGAVEDAVIKAGGDIILRSGMHGDTSRVGLVSGGDIIAKYLQSCNVLAKRDVSSDTIVHSVIRCGRNVNVKGSKGLLMGGSTRSFLGVNAITIGSPSNIRTEVYVGIDVALLDEREALKKALAACGKELTSLGQIVNFLAPAYRAGTLTEDKKETLKKALAQQKISTQIREDMEARAAEIDEKMEINTNGKVQAIKTIYRGVVISIGKTVYPVNEDLLNSSVNLKGSEIVIGACARG